MVTLRSRKRQPIPDGDGRVTRRRVILWDRQRAQQCIEQDYLGPTPAFGLDDFKRIFRVSRSSYDVIKRCVCEMDLFFRDGLDVTGKRRVSTDAKLLISLKYLGHGCSVNAFRDYFQVGESTALLSIKKIHEVHCQLMFAEEINYRGKNWGQMETHSFQQRQH